MGLSHLWHTLLERPSGWEGVRRDFESGCIIQGLERQMLPDPGKKTGKWGLEEEKHLKGRLREQCSKEIHQDQLGR